VLKGFLKKTFISIQFSVLKSDKTLSLSPAKPGPPVGPGRPVGASLPGQTRPGGLGQTDRSHPPRSLSSSSSHLLWRLHRPATAALDSDELHRSPPLRWVPVDRSGNDAPACPRDLVDCPLGALVSFAYDALDLGHGDLELVLELLDPSSARYGAWRVR
jgi:hypothetical protein